jgi:predicted nucleic-acid-binding Zn-ribbon protein
VYKYSFMMGWYVIPKYYFHSNKNLLEMIHTQTCPKCGSHRIAGPHKIAGQHYVRIDLPGFSTATLESFTCADCGFTELYADQVGLRNINDSGRFVLGSAQQEQQFEKRTCPYCGSELRPGSMTCHECGQFVS